jgi:hypothetical protein
MGCGSTGSVNRNGANGGSGASAGNGGAHNGNGGTGANIAAGGFTLGIGGGGGGGIPTGNEDTCDGVDNDGNGIIDDVDIGHDGVCDCLDIATIGRLGVWGTGDIFAGWLDSRSPIGAVALGDQVLTPEMLKPFQVIVVLNVSDIIVEWRGQTLDPDVSHAYSAEEAKALGDWVRAGGGLMTTIGYNPDRGAEVVNFNRLLADTTMLYSTTAFDTTGDVTNWAPHPVTEGMIKAWMDKGIEPQTAVGTTVAWDTQNHPCLQVGEVGQGHVAMWGDEWITYDSEWVNTTDLQIEHLWLNIFKWLSPAKVCQVTIPPIIH